MSAPLGNNNAGRAKKWRAAIERALIRKGGGKSEYDGIEPSPEMKALDELADKFVAAADTSDLGFMKELGDRLDGKPAQQVIHSGDDSDPLRIIHESR